ncbi:FtsK/SpoIIIE family DNA translocase [Chengkuizengella axinellae]|uniref:DNA translocase FtsK n=1 Tax=Chengkuizengella axinellae TaxID=3064388 RepID=A0ABT9IVY7_9BACL|nr:DNA translocase FtsK [Chengkuizengella sp. 2205SS18-9]MDP5273502.1 DNA translocase FtsK [Chengkuizengella sp. 2205SS18-9]
MARKRKKKKSVKVSMKFEIYGILIIILSIISLAGKELISGIGAVGHAFSYIFYFLFGTLYYILPLILIYIGLYVMIKREWPLSWSYKKTGITLIIFGLLIFFHMDLLSKMEPQGNYTSLDILTIPYQNMLDHLLDSKSDEAFISTLGGGMIGAVLYAMLHFLFDDLGSQLIMITFFIIGIMCLTGMSFVDVAKNIKTKTAKVKLPFKLKFKNFFTLFKDYKNAKSNRRSSKYEEDEFDDSDDLEENFVEESFHEATIEDKNDSDIATLDQPPFENDSGVQINIGSKSKTFEVKEKVPTHETQKEELEHHSDQDAMNESFQVTSSPANTSEVQEISIKTEYSDTYHLPPIKILSSKINGGGKSRKRNQYRTNEKKLEATLESFGVSARVIDVVPGPTVTRYEVQPDIGVKVSRIVSLTDDIALALAAKDIRMEAPIPGKSAIGIEVPNSEVSVVTLKEVMESSIFLESNARLSISLGKDISGQPIIADLAKMPHLLVAGATGSGKSVCVNGIITSILFKAKPNEVKFLMIDPKKVELNVYNGIPHLLAPVVTDPRRASLALRKIVSEMENRYELFSTTGTRNIEGYNEYLKQTQSGEPLPYIVVIVDELADLMMVAANDVEDAICRLAQMARAAGIHLIIATQRPSVNVITGVIKANIPSRIAFGVSSQVDSRTILDSVGAEKLLGRGDMLFLPVGLSKPIRIQGAFLSDQEVETVVNYVKNQRKAEYNEDIVPEVNDQEEEETEPKDELFDQAVQIIIEAKQASVSLLQRKMRIGYTRAARLIDSMEAKGYVGPYEGSKPREVMITAEQLNQNQMSS